MQNKTTKIRMRVQIKRIFHKAIYEHFIEDHRRATDCLTFQDYADSCMDYSRPVNGDGPAATLCEAIEAAYE